LLDIRQFKLRSGADFDELLEDLFEGVLTDSISSQLVEALGDTEFSSFDHMSA